MDLKSDLQLYFKIALLTVRSTLLFFFLQTIKNSILNCKAE